jgi:hypothetical protein
MTSMTVETAEPRTGHEDFVREGAVRAIQAAARGYFTRRWVQSEWSDDDEEDHITTADLLRLTSGQRCPAGSCRTIRAAGAYYGRHPQAIVDDRGKPFRALSQSCIYPCGFYDPTDAECDNSGDGLWVMPEHGGPRKVAECPCCDSSDIIVRGFSGGGVGVDENVYCGACGEFLGVEL